MKMNSYGSISRAPDNLLREVQACRSCLKTDVKLFNLYERQLAHTFEEFLGMSVGSTDGLPLNVCGICLHLIVKFIKFKTQCWQALRNLHQLLAANQLTTSNIRLLDKKETSTDLKTTKSEIYSYTPPPPNVNFEITTFHIDVSGNPENIEVPIEEVLVNYSDSPDDVELKKEYPDSKNNIKIINLHHEEFNAEISGNDFNDEYDYKTYENELDSDLKEEIGETGTEEVDIAEEIVKENKKRTKKRKIDKQESGRRVKSTKLKKEERKKKQRKVRAVTKTEKRGRRKTDKITTNESLETARTDSMAKDELDVETDQNRKNALLFYNSHPTKKVSQTELNKRMDMLDKFSKTYNVDIKFLNKEEQKVELEERKRYYKYMPYTCDLCYRGYSIEDAYHSHMAVHDPSSGDYECHVCKIRCKTYRDREKHVNATHLKRFRCKQCGVVTKSQSYAKAHFNRHSGASYACDTCGKRFTQQTNYLSHMRSAHSDRARLCPLCYDAFLGPLGLKVHMGIVHRQAVSCAACGSQFENDKALNKHMESSIDNVCEVGVRSCPACGVNFSSEKLMKKHYDDTHKSELKCDQCNKSFPTKFKLSTHIHEHMRSNEAPVPTGFICESCGRGNFKNLNQLRSHQRVHTGERPYKCTMCPKTFRINTLLKSHMTIHTDERRYKCPLCPKAFHQSAHRSAHLLTHTKERPYTCSACPKRYTSASAAREHADTVHRGLPARRREKHAHT